MRVGSPIWLRPAGSNARNLTGEPGQIVDYAPNIAPFSPNTVWYVQVCALVAGHVAGLAVAHDRAVTILSERDALRSQYAMLGLMVLYTVAGLWLLSWD